MTLPESQKRKIICLLSWLFVLAWVIVIFILSSQPAEVSNKLSKSITRIIIKIIDLVHTLDIETGTMQNWLDVLNNKVREYAHVMVFLILAVLVVNAFERSGAKNVKTFVFSFAFCAVYALSDEIHQTFVPGRGAEVADFLIDCTGTLLGLTIYFLVGLAFRSGNKLLH